jgi:hypothetical protein
MAGLPPAAAVQQMASSPAVPDQDMFVYPIQDWDKCVDKIALDFLKDSLECTVDAWNSTASRSLLPLLTTADGNCLAHAVSLAMHGDEEQSVFIRMQIHHELEQHRGWYLAQLPSVTEEIFDHELQAAGEDERFMDAGTGLHFLAVANALKRPVLLIASRKHMQNPTWSNCATYLPCRIPHAEIKSKIPIIIAWQRPDFTGGAGHFVCVAPTSAGPAILPAGWLPPAFPQIDEDGSTALGNYVAIEADGSLIINAPRVHKLWPTASRRGNLTVIRAYESVLCNFIFTCFIDGLFRAIMIAFNMCIPVRPGQLDGRTVGMTATLGEINQCAATSHSETNNAVWRLQRVNDVVDHLKTDTSSATVQRAQQVLAEMSDGTHNHPGRALKFARLLADVPTFTAASSAQILADPQAMHRRFSRDAETQIMCKDYMRAETTWMKWMQSHTCEDPQTWRSDWSQASWVVSVANCIQMPDNIKHILSQPEQPGVFPVHFLRQRNAVGQKVVKLVDTARQECQRHAYAAAVNHFDAAISLDPDLSAGDMLRLSEIQTERDNALSARVIQDASVAGLHIDATILMQTSAGIVDVRVARYDGEQVVVVTEEGQYLVLGATVAEAEVAAAAAQQQRTHENQIQAARLKEFGLIQMQPSPKKLSPSQLQQKYERAIKTFEEACQLSNYTDKELLALYRRAVAEADVYNRMVLAMAVGLETGAQLWMNLHGSRRPTQVWAWLVDHRKDKCIVSDAPLGTQIDMQHLQRTLSIMDAVPLVCDMAECPLALDNYPVELCWRHDGCRWVSIEMCRHSLRVALKDRNLPTCACPDCDHILSDEDVWAILEGEEDLATKMALIDDLAVVKDERFFDDKHRCPVMHGDEQCRGCIVIDPDDDDKRMHCEICGMDSCVNCKAYPYHHGCECGELVSLTSSWQAWCRKQRADYLRTEDRKYQRALSAAQRARALEMGRLEEQHRQKLASEKAMEKEMRRCPFCNHEWSKVENTCEMMRCGENAADKVANHGLGKITGKLSGCGREFRFNPCNAGCTDPCTGVNGDGILHAKPYIADAGQVRLPNLQAPARGYQHMWAPGDPMLCSQCNAPIQGLMFECVHCVEHRLCLDCDAQEEHDVSHVFRILDGLPHRRSGGGSAARLKPTTKPPIVGCSVARRTSTLTWSSPTRRPTPAPVRPKHVPPLQLPTQRHQPLSTTAHVPLGLELRFQRSVSGLDDLVMPEGLNVLGRRRGGGGGGGASASATRETVDHYSAMAMSEMDALDMLGVTGTQPGPRAQPTIATEVREYSGYELALRLQHEEEQMLAERLRNRAVAESLDQAGLD